MRLTKKKLSAAVCAIVALLCVLDFLLYQINWSARPETILQNQSEISVGYLTDDTVLVQSIWPGTGEVESFSVLFATFERVNRCNVRVRLLDSEGGELYRAVLKAKELQDNAYVDFAPPEPIPIDDQPVFLEITSDARRSGNAVTVWRSQSDGSYPGGTLRINDEETDGDLCFRMNYRPVRDWRLIARRTGIFAALILTPCILILFFYRKSEKGLFEVVVDHRYSIVGALFVLMVLFRIHGFSTNLWNSILSGGETGLDCLFGVDRPITMDAYGTVLPQIFSQCENGFSLYNYNISSEGANALLYGLPAWDLSILGRPSQWGFLLLGKEMGLSWFYWFRMFGLLLSSFEVCMFLSRKNKLASAISAVLITCSPMVQWWGCHSLPEILLYGQMMLAGFYRFFEDFDSFRKKVLSTAVTAISAVGFVLMLYPAILVPYGYLVLLLGAAVVLRYRKRVCFRRQDAVLVTAAVCLTLIVVGRFVWISAEDMSLMLNTVAPGKRFSVGGEYSLDWLLASLFQWKLPYCDARFYNNCEVSQMIPLTVPVLLGFPFVMSRDRQNRFQNRALYFSLLFYVCWLVFQFPEWFASASLMRYVIPSRLMWTVGAISIYIAAVMMDFFMRKCCFSWKKTLCIALGVQLVYVFAAQRANWAIPMEGSPMGIALSLSGIGLLTVFFLRWKKTAFAAMVLLFTLVSSVAVQPLNIGADAFYENALSETVERLKAEDADALWLTADDYPLSNYLLVHGVDVFNATNLYPDYTKWEKVDPERRYEEFYNRYCHVSVELGQETGFQLLASEHIKLTLRSEDLPRLGVRYVLSGKAYKEKPLRQIYCAENEGLYIYEVQEVGKAEKQA